MSFADLTDAALGAITDTLGEEVIYTLAGGDPETITGVFNAKTQVVEGDTPVLSTQPSVLIRLSDLSDGTAVAIGDTVLVRSVTYNVSDIDKDGEGGALLLLHKSA